MKPKLTPLDFGAALLVALLWLGVGVVKRSNAGQGIGQAVLAELPLSALLFLLALFLIYRRKR